MWEDIQSTDRCPILLDSIPGIVKGKLLMDGHQGPDRMKSAKADTNVKVIKLHITLNLISK